MLRDELVTIETDPETGLDTIVVVKAENVYRQPFQIRGHIGWATYDAWGQIDRA